MVIVPEKMKNIKITNLKNQVKNLLIEASFYLPDDIMQSIKAARQRETNPVASKMLDYMLENEKIARVQKLPLCQDCWTVYINLEIGPDICLENGFTEALNNVIKHSYKGESDKPIEVVVNKKKKLLEIEIIDTGEARKSFEKPTLDFDPDDIQSLPEGGMGLFIIEEIMNETNYKVVDGKNIFIMRKFVK